MDGALLVGLPVRYHRKGREGDGARREEGKERNRQREVKVR